MAAINILKNNRSLLRASNDLEIKELDSVVKTIKAIIADRKEEEKKLKLQQAAKLKKVDEIKKQMAEAGIDIGDLDKTLRSKIHPSKSKRKRMPFKYEIKSPDGTLKQWSGKGRAPNLIMEYLKNGGDIESLLIAKK